MEENIFDLESVNLRVPSEIRAIGVVNEYKSSSIKDYLDTITADDFRMIEESSEFFMQEDAKTINEVKNYIVL